MSNTDLIKFQELLNTDAEFQEKLKNAAEQYTGEADAEQVFENILLPLGKEYGLSATFEEFKAYLDNNAGGLSSELSEDELEQVAGGKLNAGGLGVAMCAVIGFGAGGGAGSDGGGLCVAVGIGWNAVECYTVGSSEEIL